MIQFPIFLDFGLGTMFDVSVGEGAGDETKKKDLHARYAAPRSTTSKNM